MSFLDFWTPALVEVPYVFASGCLLINPSFHSQCKVSERANNFFLLFVSHEIRKMMKIEFWSLDRSGDSKKSQKLPENEVLGFLDKNLNHSCILSWLLYKNISDIPTFWEKKQYLIKTSGFLSYGPKTSRSIRMHCSSIYNISQTSRGLELNFCKQ